MTAERINNETITNWELHHRIFCVKNYYKCGLVKKISEQFHTLFEVDKELQKSVIQYCVGKFETYTGIGLRLTVIRNPLTVSAILDDPGLVYSKL